MKITKKTFKGISKLIFVSILIITLLFSISLAVNAAGDNGGNVTSDGFWYQNLPNGTINVYGYTGNAKDVVVPSKINGKKVVMVTSILYEDNLVTETVTIPDTVTEIACDTFRAPNLKSITIKGYINEYESNTFSNLPKLEKIIIESNTNAAVNMAVRTIVNCPSLTTVTIPSGVHSLDNEVISNCSKVQDIYIPQSCTQILRNAFGDVTEMHHEGKIHIYSHKNEYVKQFAQDYKYDYTDISTTFNTLAVPETKSVKSGVKYKTTAVSTSSELIKTSYTSSNSKIATVTADGTVTALNKGESTITAKVYHAYYPCYAKALKSVIKVTTAPKLSKTSVTVKKGKTTSITLTGKAAAIKNVYTNTKYVKFTSSATAAKLTIKGIKKGTSTVKVKVNGVKTLSVKVKVN